jgi:putative ATP-dependent endonuclease of OLD family
VNLIKIVVKNYRMLKNLELDLEQDLSLVIGKNNCGKTSLLSVLNKFLGGQSASNNFNYDDFNIDFKTTLFSAVENNGVSWDSMQPQGIETYLFISYGEGDNLANIRPLMLDLDPNNNIAILKFEYVLNKEALISLIEAFSKYYLRFKDDPNCKLDKSACFDNFIKNKHRQYFKINKKTILYDTIGKKPSDTEYRLLDSTVDINKIICFKYISARRDTVNKDNDGTLSSLSGRYYEKTKSNDNDPTIQKFEDALLETDTSLTNIYQGLFQSVIKKVKKFGGIRENETIVKIISTLSQQQLLKGNTTVVYEAENHQLPESYNGLGYLNLISVIIEVETLLSEFRNDKDTSDTPANINLLFIEEPEAHTHPQMQYIFIKNIKNLLLEGASGEEGKKKFDLQTIITTHSSHIVSECDFDDIKYFQKISQTSVISKNLKELEIAYKNEKDPQNNHFKFLKQYLTLNYSEIFFADKVILYEGETEKILLPAMMKKIDDEESDEQVTPLLSQNISLIEAGAYSQIFDHFLSFIDIKTLIITDIDAGKQVVKPDKNGIDRITINACPISEGTHTTNAALKHYYEMPLQEYKGTQLEFFTSAKLEDKVLCNKEKKWYSDSSGKLMMVFQIRQGEDSTAYYPRSFEDAFFQINREFIISNKNTFASLKNIDYFSELNPDETYKFNPYELADACISSKASFALDVLLNSTPDNSFSFPHWKIPLYIKEGLLWLRQNS